MVMGWENCATMFCMKTCSKCGEAKSVTDFRTNLKLSDGLDSWCKRCHNKAKSDWLNRNPLARAAAEKRKYRNKMLRERGDNYVVGAPENRRGGPEVVLTDEVKRLRHNSRRVTRRAIKSGKIVSCPCFVCGHQEVEAHHPDYSRPLDVVWLCKEHHLAIHKS